MMTIALIALVAGAASALMFASIISGALISLVLFYLSPLPLMVAAIGWGPFYASLGGIAAAIGLGAIFGLPYCIAFAVTVALPAWWLGHLVLLGRPVAPATDAIPPAEPEIEWYPVGRILLWVAGFAVVTSVAALLTLGSDADAIISTLKRGLMRILRAADPQPTSETDQFIDALVKIAPAGVAIVSMMTLTLNLWLSAKVTATSGRLRRPWPDLMTAELPPMTLAVLCLAIAFCFTSGMLAMVAQIATAALMLAYALTGFAVLHTVTLTLKSRAFWLSTAYVVVVVFGWPVIAMVVLGLADAVFGVRDRFWRSRMPPPLPTTEV